MEITLRQEEKKDFETVAKITEGAFKNAEHSDHKEHLLVNRLRTSDAFIPELSIVAELNGEIVGHILFTKIKIIDEDNINESLALAPVSVKQEFQGKGIGGKLITYGHKIASQLGYKSVVLIGHENYYPKFGYQIADTFGIKLPFDIPKENFMAIELIEDGLKNITGKIKYSKEFEIE